MKRLAAIVGGALILAAFVCGYIAYFVLSIDPATQQMADGFGRPLVESPMFMRILMGKDPHWAGWFWFAIDMLIFWSCLLIGFGLVKYGVGDEKAASR